MYNPYCFFPQQNQNIMPQQQIIQVNGKASVDTMQMAPNSSLLAMDTSAPIVWLCVSDGIGKVTATPYDIIAHKEEPPADMRNIEQRLAAIEATIAEMEERNAKSNSGRSKSKQSLADDSAD